MFGKLTMIGVAMAGLWAAPVLATEPVIAVAASARAADGTTAVDAEFSEIFTDWSELENGGRVTDAGEILAAPRTGVSVPSGMPMVAVAITSGFGMRDHPILHMRRQHQGIDLAAPRGTPVYATADGIVGMAQWYSSYGNYVQIEHGGDMETRFGHLTSFTVQAGDAVHKGDLIGYVGTTGRSTGPHLHYEVRVANVAVDPRPYMVPASEIVMADDDEQAARGGPE